MATLDNSKPTETTQLLKEVNNQSSPVLKQVSNIKENSEQYFKQLVSYKNQAFEKGTQYKSIVVEKGTYYKDLAMEKGKNHKVTKYTEEQLTVFVTYMETQVQLLNKTYLHKNIDDQTVAIDSPKKELVKRIQVLGQQIRIIAKLAIIDQLEYIKQLPITQKGVSQYKLLLQNPKVREAIIFTSITTEFLSDLIQTKLLAPSITFYDEKSGELKSQTKIVFENVQSKVVKQYVPFLASKYQTLKQGTVYFYGNCMTVQFAQKYYESNQTLIQKEMKSLIASFKDYQTKVQDSYRSLYGSALSSYKKRREEMISRQQIEEKQVVNDVKTDDSQLSAKKIE